MRKNSLWKCNDQIYRILDVKSEKVLAIDCVKKSMPKWIQTSGISNWKEITEIELLSLTSTTVQNYEDLSAESRCICHERFTMIASIIPYIGEKKVRCHLITQTAADRHCSERTITNYLCNYLAIQRVEVLAPKTKEDIKELTADEKNMRWALNKFFYNKNKNTLTTTYTLMLKEKYCDESGTLLPHYPSIYQFRYFYKKTLNLQTYYISRDGIKDYQRNNRPLLGEGIQEFASNVGIGMLDATICDIYLITDAGDLIGRPVLVACIDAYSSLCMGYSLLWEGGMYSLRNLMLNVITDKVAWCQQQGIHIGEHDWESSKMPAVLVTDMGSEYVSANFEQLAELGITIINLPAYRPELKGSVEKFFDLIQTEFKKHLKGKGVIESDYQERGAHDYRKDACLTMKDFEKIILRCIVYYNSQRIVEAFPYTTEMIMAAVKPYANELFAWGCLQQGANLIPVSRERLIMTLLPRTAAKFGRTGLKANKMRYHAEGYTEWYLKGSTAVVAYNPDDVSRVWLLENGKYVPFELIESRFKGKSLNEVMDIQSGQKTLIRKHESENLQAQIGLAQHLQALAENAVGRNTGNIKGIRATRNREQAKSHIDFMKEGNGNE